MDLAKLLRFLHDVRVKWYDIGIQLNISTGTLDAIRQENHSDCGKCLREMVKDWLNRKAPQATFDDLIDALTSEPVGENTLAENTRHLDVAITSEAGIHNALYIVLYTEITMIIHHVLLLACTKLVHT